MSIVIILSIIEHFQLTPIDNNLWSNNSSFDSPPSVMTDNSEANSNDNKLSICNLTYTILDADFSKGLQGLPKPITYPPDVIFDSNDKIVSDHSFVFIKMSIRNELNKDIVISINNAMLYTYEQNKHTRSLEMLTMDANQGQISNRDYFHFNLLANSEYTFTCGFIIDDRLLNEAELVLCVAPRGAGPQTPQEDIGYIDLNEFLENLKENE